MDADVCVVGLGHIGLPTALLAAQSNDVVGVDVDEDYVDSLSDGRLPLDEPGLEKLYDRVCDRFEARTNVADAATYVVVTPTPVRSDSGIADVGYVRAATESIATELDAGDLVLLESTVPPGTTERLVRPTLAESGVPQSDFHVAYSPERASPGDTLDEMVTNARVVGGATDEATAAATAFYETFVDAPIRTTTPRTAELVKLMENTYRDVNIALANEFAILAEEFDLDVREAIDLANEHPRVTVHRPGPGVGGHCIPVDPQFISQHTTQDRLISLAREVNSSMAGHVARRTRQLLDDAATATVTLFGVAYKGDVGDTRETPAAPVAELLTGFGYDVRVYDPHVDDFSIDPVPLTDAVDGSDLVVVLTDHSEFATVTPESFAEQMSSQQVFDTRGIIDEDRWEDAGFDVAALGDGSPSA